jgi:hypothetical protein
MKKLLATAAVTTFIALASIAATSAPASAGGISFGTSFGGFDFDDDGYGWDDDSDFEISIEVPSYDDEDEDEDDDGSYPSAHTDWCDNHYQTYDEDSNLYFFKPGKQTQCVSPYWPG